MIKAVIFDMDGVLIDSSKYIWESFNKIFKESGFQANNSFIKKHTGMSLRDQLEKISTEFGIIYELENFQKKALKTQLELMKKILGKDKKLINLIIKIKKMKLKIAVATSSTRVRAKKILKLLGIKKYLNKLVTCESVEKHKPNPDIYLETAKKLRLKPAECIVVEDAVNGVISGKRAKMKVAGLITRFHGKNELNKAGADFVIKSLEEIPYIIEKLNKIK